MRTQTQYTMNTLAACLMAASGALAQPAEAAPPPKPNVLFIVFDDLNDAVEGMGGHPQAKTPNIDRLVKRGVRFTNASCNGTVCAPSRTSFLSGQYPTTTGLFENQQALSPPRVVRESVPIPAHFAAHGYDAMGTGKVIHGPTWASEKVWGRAGGGPARGPMMGFGPRPWDGGSNARRRPESGHHPSMPPALVNYHDCFAPLSDVPELPPDPGKGIPGYRGWVLNDNGRPFRYVSEDDRDRMPDEASAAWAVERLKERHARPFFLAVGFYRPHTPLFAPKKYFDLFPPDEIELPPHLDGDLTDCAAPLSKPDWGVDRFRDVVDSGGVPLWKRWIQAYLACVAFADAQAGAVLDALDESAYAGNTIVILTSDHGYHMGEKERLSKGTRWEETARVPLVIVAPGITPAGAACDQPVSLVDLYPTLIDLCGLPKEPNAAHGGPPLQGHSLRPLLEDPAAGKWEGPPVALTAQHGPVGGPHLSVRSKRYRYIRCANGEEELYDHAADPQEYRNLAGDPEHQQIKKKLHAQMTALLEKAGGKPKAARVDEGAQVPPPASSQGGEAKAAAAPGGRTYHVAPAGSNDKPGTAEQPFQTINHAAQILQPGDTVVVHEGVYRERVTPARGGDGEEVRITYTAAPGERVVIKGSEIWDPDWQRESGANVFHARPDDALFNDDVYVDDKNPFRVRRVDEAKRRDRELKKKHRDAQGQMSLLHADFMSPLTLGQVFVDGQRYTEVLRANVAKKAGTWAYDRETGHIHIHFPAGDPAAHTVEITTRRSIFRPHVRGLGYVTVRGFVMEHCGNQMQLWGDLKDCIPNGALCARGGHHWVVEENTVRHAKHLGITASHGCHAQNIDNERNPMGRNIAAYNIIRNNRVTDNGACGIICSQPPEPGPEGYFGHTRIVGNYLARNNYLGYVNSVENAAIKGHRFYDGEISGNVIVDNPTNAIWLDCGYEGTRVNQNLIARCRTGATIEVGFCREGHEMVFDNNLILSCNDGIVFSIASDFYAAHNLIANCSHAFRFNLQDRWYRERFHDKAQRCELVNVHVCNNLLAGNRQFGTLHGDGPDEVVRDFRFFANILEKQPVIETRPPGRTISVTMVENTVLDVRAELGADNRVLCIDVPDGLPRVELPEALAPYEMVDYLGEKIEATPRPGPVQGLRPGKQEFDLCAKHALAAS